MPRKIYPDDLSGLNDDELAAIKVSIETDLASVKQQLDEAKGNAQAYGDYSDPNWYSRAMGAKRFLGIKHQQVITEISRRRRASSSAASVAFERAFVSSARTILDPELFARIVDDANARMV